MIIRIIPLVIASLLLAAHFLRHGDIGFVVMCLVVPLLLLIKNRRSLIFVQFSAYAGAAVWVYTALQIVRERMMFGRPWGLAVIILGTVALFTVIAGLLLNSRAIKDKYPSS